MTAPISTPIESPLVAPLPSDALWPQGTQFVALPASELDAALNDTALTGLA